MLFYYLYQTFWRGLCYWTTVWVVSAYKTTLCVVFTLIFTLIFIETRDKIEKKHTFGTIYIILLLFLQDMEFCATLHVPVILAFIHIFHFAICFKPVSSINLHNLVRYVTHCLILVRLNLYVWIWNSLSNCQIFHHYYFY